ncbi:MAG: DUF448 domain-containing protein [Magnetococcales bacterium]|nr:DUF448 domain-containing protein [Magnetococcales bacterium]
MRRIKSKKSSSCRDTTSLARAAEPGRMCVVTRKTADKSFLLRFVVGPDGSLVEDVTGKLPGRGRYVLPSSQNIAQLLKRSGIKGEALEQQLERIAQALLRRLLDGLNLARRAGDLRWGMRAVTEMVDGLANASTKGKTPPPMLWLLAKDAASNTRDKFTGQCRKVAAITQQDPEVFELLDRDHFGGVCGGNEIAVLIVYSDGMVRRVKADVVRLQSFLVAD